MTIKEVIKGLQDLKNNSVSGYTDTTVIIDMAIKYLKTINKDMPVLKGVWQPKPDGVFIYVKCSVCGRLHNVPSNYCPSCGCLMDSDFFNTYIKSESENK